MKHSIGMIGCGVMGQNLALNFEQNAGLNVTMYDLDWNKVQEYLNTKAAGRNIIGAKTLEELAASLSKPRRIMMMVPAGKAVDACIESLIPHLETGDILIDGGNTHYPDTNRRTKYVESKGFRYIGTGVSGGEEGALKGPSIMPGGSPSAWPDVKEMFQAIAAKTSDGTPCCDWVGENGAGHFVKMVHNGIEYGDMQMICEVYQLMKMGLGLSNSNMHDIFAEWNKGELDSYLIEITRDILAFKDEKGNYVLDQIQDTAGQKGTGKWTVFSALDSGMPLTLISEAVFARCISAMKEERVAGSKILPGPNTKFEGDPVGFIEDLRKALYAAKIVSYAQGYQLMREIGREEKWNLNFGGIALMWRGGCIIRSAFLGKIKEAFDADSNLVNLLVAPFFRDVMINSHDSLRRVVCKAVELGVPLPAMGAALAYYDSYRCERLPANLLQAQRDYFGAHTYERVDKPRGEFFHTKWIS